MKSNPSMDDMAAIGESRDSAIGPGRKASVLKSISALTKKSSMVPKGDSILIIGSQKHEVGQANASGNSGEPDSRQIQKKGFKGDSDD
mmetsp:Transcript_7651/g.10834  ORF Transcript_7651/g.10834 Transcript_7651/m.10834 type:complete len:88 (-) Transcript_7651:1635-1898(-)